MMKSSRNRSPGDGDHMVQRFQRARSSLSGAWRCRPCEGDIISPSPKSRQKGQDLKKTSKNDFLKDPLFMKQSSPEKTVKGSEATVVREDDRLAPEWQQFKGGHGKESESKESISQRGKVDGLLMQTPQRDPDELKVRDEKVGNLEEKAAVRTPETALWKTESCDVFEIVNGELVSAEGARDGIQNAVSAESQPASEPAQGELKVRKKLSAFFQEKEASDSANNITVSDGDALDGVTHVVSANDLHTAFNTQNSATEKADSQGDTVRSETTPLQDGKDSQDTGSSEELSVDQIAKPENDGALGGAKRLDYPYGDSQTEFSPKHGVDEVGKGLPALNGSVRERVQDWEEKQPHHPVDGVPEARFHHLNVYIPCSKVDDLHKAGDGKLKAWEEEESPQSVLQGIPDLETPKGKGEREAPPTLLRGIPEAEPEPSHHHILIGPESLKDLHPANNITHDSFPGSKLETEQLELPTDDVQTLSSQFSEIPKQGKEIGSPEAEDGKKANNGLYEKQSHGEGLEDPKQDALSSEELVAGNWDSPAAAKRTYQDETQDTYSNGEVAAESKLNEMAAASIHGTGEDGSSHLYPDHPDYTELQHYPNHGEENFHPFDLQEEEPKNWKLGFFSVPHVIVVGAITVVSMLGKAARN